MPNFIEFVSRKSNGPVTAPRASAQRVGYRITAASSKASTGVAVTLQQRASSKDARALSLMVWRLSLRIKMRAFFDLFGLQQVASGCREREPCILHTRQVTTKLLA